MIAIEKIMGRLSNKLFIMAAHYAWCKDNDIPFFVQDEKYFKKYEADIRQMYSEGIVSCGIDKISIHVRRGKNPVDLSQPSYARDPFYVDLGHHLHEDMRDNYYVKAMNRFPTGRFLVFSDDIEWCKQQLMFRHHCEFIGGDPMDEKQGIEHFNMMASCTDNIIANSSYSWWAAWLNPNPNKMVIAPAKWFANEENEKLIGIPDSWVRL